MGATYSPHRDGGGILHFPSATHLHNVDPASAIRQLRRSLSRSPSKGPAFRLITSKSASPSSCSPLSPSPLSPQKRVGSVETTSSYNVTSPSPLAVPFPPSAKKGRANPRKLSPMRGLTRSSSNQRSPIKRGLSNSTSHGNAVPTSPISSGLGTENRTPRSPTPETKSCMDNIPNTMAFGTTEPLLAPHHAFTRFEKGNGYPLEFAAKSSPLKRSDGIMNLDQASLGSPSAKRRSLHGASFSPDFNIFDHEVAVSSYTQYDTYNLEDGSKPENSSSAEQSVMFSPLPRRTSSLRRTTLQQRYEKPTFARSRPNTDLAFELATPGQTALKGRPRISLDSFIPPSARESPFTSQGSLPNASVHTISNNRKEPHVNPPQLPSRHPLSRTMTQSSSNSSLAEESPTHVPLRQPEQRRPLLEFSKSLPIGVVRPQGREPISHEESEHTTSTETSFATPENYKLAKPLPAAFMSTGLISKKNRNMDLLQSDFHKSTTSVMPDTPCKRSNNLPPAVPPPVHQGSGNKTRQNRHSLHSFGTPSTPFNPYVTRRDSATFETGKNIFGSSFSGNGLARRDSFVGIVDDDMPCSPVGKGDIQSGTDTDVSPTPARTTMNENLRQPRQDHDGNENAGSSSDLEVFGHETKRNSVYCKSTPKRTPCKSIDEDGDSIMEESPCAAPRFKSFSSISSYSNRSHLFRKSPVSTSVSKISHTLPCLRVRNIKTKPSPLSPASPLQDHFRQVSPHTPHTPQESVLPPDPSGLSISVRRDGLFNQSSNEFSSSASSYPPATPTASRDYFPQYGKQRSSFTPIHKSAPVDVDSTLTSRFDKVEVIGNGEFSHVYRVAQLLKFETQPGSSVLSVPQASSKTELTDQVWAVKKTRNAYIGPRDRRRKLQEVEILKALGHSDHAVQLFDSWEHNDHLYIQTEFCEEGTLDVFLDQVGRKARLDDFRIWKIMLELSLVICQKKFISLVVLTEY